MNYQIINQDDQLVRVCAIARQADVVMLDTEFVRTRTFFPQLGLIQLYDGENLSLIDPLSIQQMSPLVELLQDVSVLKVLHACGEDLEVFQNSLGCVPFPMVDTQLMAAFIGYGLSTGFASLVNDLLTIELDKSESRTDWLARPLSAKQLEYAAADVFYLYPLYQQLLDKVSQAGRWDAVLQESQLQVDKRIRVVDPQLAYLDIKGAWQLKPKELAILKPLATWRYQQAVKRDLALNFVVREHDLLAIARLALSSATRMEQEGIDPHVIRRHSDAIIRIVKQAKQTPVDQYPEAIIPLMEMPGYKQLFKKLKDQVKVVAQTSGLASEFLASKKQLNQLVSWVWNHRRDPEKLPDLMQYWRRPLIGEKLNQLID